MTSEPAADGARIERELDRLLTDPGRRVEPKLLEAMRYSVIDGGKRIRPLLCLASARAVGGSVETALPFACAIEMIHAYSLIHDDLPAMDDDPVRRGRPSSHVAFGEAHAILAGDGLLTEAFAVAARESLARGLPAERVVRGVVEIATAAGAEGMVGGQVADILAEGRSAGIEEVLEIHRRKTGALLRVAVRAGAIAGGADESALERLTAFGERIGLAFQIADDVLDELGATEATGKAAQRDRERGKSTVAAALGIEPARRRLAALLDEALAAVADFGPAAGELRAIAETVLRRAL